MIGIVALFVVLRKVPLKKPLQDFLAWVDAIGFWGPVVLGVVYVIGCVVCLPGTILTLAAGALFGVVGGAITVSIASTLGACAAFVVGRTLARDWIAAKVEGNAKFKAIDKAVGREGFKIVLLTRLSPMFPFNLLNFGYGLTDVRLGHYALASWIGMLPGTIIFVYFGSALGSIADAFAERGEKTAAETVLFWIGMVVAIAATVFVTRIARRALNEECASARAPAGPSRRLATFGRVAARTFEVRRAASATYHQTRRSPSAASRRSSTGSWPGSGEGRRNG